MTNNNIFESIKHIDDNNHEYWYARELMNVLEYKKWDKFINVINSAKISCEQSNIKTGDHFLQVGKMVAIGSDAERPIDDYELSRYAYGIPGRERKAVCSNLSQNNKRPAIFYFQLCS